MPGAERQRAGEFGLPVGFALAGAGVDEVETDPIEHRLRGGERGQPFGDVMRAAEEMQCLILQRLQAERDAVDPGGGQIGKARGLYRIGVGLQRDLDIGGEAPMILRGGDERFDQSGRHQRRRAAAEEDGRERTAAGQRRLIGHVGEQRAAPGVDIHAIANMAVKVAIGAFRHAEGPVDIERLRVGGGEGGGGNGGHWDGVVEPFGGRGYRQGTDARMDIFSGTAH